MFSRKKKEDKAQKELLLAAGIHGQVGWNWQPDVPLEEFEGVSINGAGFVVGLDFQGQSELQLDLAVFAPLTSLQELNLYRCQSLTGK